MSRSRILQPCLRRVSSSLGAVMEPAGNLWFQKAIQEWVSLERHPDPRLVAILFACDTE